jgi:hypothetical protein
MASQQPFRRCCHREGVFPPGTEIDEDNTVVNCLDAAADTPYMCASVGSPGQSNNGSGGGNGAEHEHDDDDENEDGP